MAHHERSNRVEQLEGLRNVRTQEGFYEKLAAGNVASGAASPNGSVQQYIPVPITIKAQLGSPVGSELGRDQDDKLMES